MSNSNNHPLQPTTPTTCRPDPITMVMVPFTAQSHLNQALQLSFLVSSYQIQVHYAASAEHNRQVKLRFNGGDRSDLDKIHFHDLPMPNYLSPLPDPNSTTKFPAHLQPSFDATLHLRDPVGTLLRKLSASARRLIVIHDILMSSAVQDVAHIPNAESYAFRCISVFSICCIKSLCKGESIPPVEEFFVTDDFLRLVAAQSEFLNIKQGVIYNTCKQMESAYLDLVAKNDPNVNNNNQWSIAPLINRVKTIINSTSGNNKCLLWLENQPPKSVIYVSFGSTISMTDKQIEALAIGLKESKQRFLWVLRDADKADIFTAGEVRNLKLPNGFEESVKETGIVVRDWVPQMEILAHRSVGGFMSHCGWNSCLESLSLGVPIAAWPMHTDQPYNAVLITEVLKAGIQVRDWARQSEVVSSCAIKRAVEVLMASEEGEQIRKRAEEVGGVLRDAAEEGGVSKIEMDSFIAHITR